jgi:hypothetical protein
VARPRSRARRRVDRGLLKRAREEGYLLTLDRCRRITFVARPHPERPPERGRSIVDTFPAGKRRWVVSRIIPGPRLSGTGSSCIYMVPNALLQQIPSADTPGGAFFFSSLDTHRYQVQRHARKAGARAFCPAYRLAPQYPFVRPSLTLSLPFSCK